MADKAMNAVRTEAWTGWQPAEGELIAGRFRLQHEVGRGGMACVWQALHVTLDSPCAIKFINAAAAQSSDLVARFRREARAAAKLRSRHVVQIFDYGVWKERPFIAMELLEGVSLGDQLDEQGLLTVRQVLTIAEGVGAALRVAKELGVVHRDLKPENIFVVGEGGDLYVKVLDFGIAKLAEQPAMSVQKTDSGILLGTPFYMSPEQIDGTRPVDYRSDLWSLAVVIYECLTGELPFDSSAFGNLALKILRGPIPVPSETCADLPVVFDEWWARAAARDPDQRFQSADAMVAALNEALKGVEFSAPRTSRVVMAPRPTDEKLAPDAASVEVDVEVDASQEQLALHTSAVRPSPQVPDSDPHRNSIALAPTDPPPPALQLDPPADEPGAATTDEQPAAVVPLKSRGRLWLVVAAVLVLTSLLWWWRASEAPASATKTAPTATSAAPSDNVAAQSGTTVATLAAPPSTAASATTSAQPSDTAGVTATTKPPATANPHITPEAQKPPPPQTKPPPATSAAEAPPKPTSSATTPPAGATSDYPDPGY